MNRRFYAITGANSGLGAEAVRQLVVYASSQTNIQTTIYLLCRNVDSANESIHNLSKQYPNTTFKCIQFDASNRSSVKFAIQELSNNISDELLDGLLLNAGGFTSDKKGCLCESGATIIAETNLIGHAALVDGLIESKRIGKGSRVIFSDSEAALGEPFSYKWDDGLESYVNILNGKRYGKKYSPADGYGHIKALIAFYCTAIARRNNDIYFAAVSPGSTRNTNLIDQGSFSGALKFAIKGFIRMSGQHDVSVGAKRYIDALLPDQEDWNYASGSFVLSKKGYIGDVCVATELKKGKVFSDESKQEYVYEAVQQFL